MEVIKFVDENSSREITVVDAGILELKTAAANLETSTDRIQAQIDELSYMSSFVSRM